jgi:hypothetical protein
MGQSTTILNEAKPASFNIVVLCSIKPHINQVQGVVIVLLHKALFYTNFEIL